MDVVHGFRKIIGLVPCLITSSILAQSLPTATPDTSDHAAAAARLSQAIEAADPKKFLPLLDSAAFRERVLKGLPITPNARAALGDAINERTLPGFAFGRDFRSYDFLRLVTRNGRVHAQYRIVIQHKNGHDLQVNYHEWLLVASADRTLKFVDIYDATSGEYMSQGLRRRYLRLIGEDPSLQEKDAKWLPVDELEIKNLTKLVEIGGSREPEIILERIRLLPADLQQTRFVQLHRLRAMALQVKQKPNAFDQAYAEWLKLAPEDPTFDLQAYIVWLGTGQYDRFYAAIDRIERWAGRDAHLDVIRATAALLQDKPDAAAQAEKWAQRALEADANYLAALRVLMNVQIKQKKYAQVVTTLQKVETVTKLTLDVVGIGKDDPATQQFAESKEYKAYRQDNPLKN